MTESKRQLGEKGGVGVEKEREREREREITTFLIDEKRVFSIRVQRYSNKST